MSTSGKYGAAALVIDTDTLLHPGVPDGEIHTCTVRMSNRGTASAKVRIAIGSGAAPEDADYIVYDDTIRAYGVLNDSGIVLSAGEKLWVRANTGTVSARCHGFGETA